MADPPQEFPTNPNAGCLLAVFGLFGGMMISVPLSSVFGGDWPGVIMVAMAGIGFFIGYSNLWVFAARDWQLFQSGAQPASPFLKTTGLAICAYFVVVIVSFSASSCATRTRMHEIHLADARVSTYVGDAYGLCQDEVRKQLAMPKDRLSFPFQMFDSSPAQNDPQRPKLNGNFLDHGEIVDLRFDSWVDIKSADHKTTRRRWTGEVRTRVPVWRDLEKIEWIVERVTLDP